MTLGEFLELELLTDNLIITLEKNKPCDGHCEDCSCDTHPLIHILRNCDIITKEMIIKKGGEDFLNYEIKRITPLKNYKSRIVLKNKELL